jgi:hypothetical protein
VCFSNAPGPLYLGTSHRCRRGLTAPYRTEATGVDNVLQWLTSGDARTAYYVWYYHSDPEEMIGDPHALLAGHVVDTRRTGDGEILSLVGGVRSARPGRAAERPSETTQLPRQ